MKVAPQPEGLSLDTFQFRPPRALLKLSRLAGLFQLEPGGEPGGLSFRDVMKVLHALKGHL
jgi:hypothetical protein